MRPRMPRDEWFGDHSGWPHHWSPSIILLPFSWIGEDLIGFLDFLKLCLPFLSSIIRVVLLSQTPICPSDGMQALCGSNS